MNIVTVSKYPNAIIYNIKNRRILIKAINDNTYKVQFKTLLILNDEEKKRHSDNNNCNTFLQERPHSKYCIFINVLNLSKEAMICILHSEQFIDKIKPFNKEAINRDYNEQDKDLIP